MTIDQPRSQMISVSLHVAVLLALMLLPSLIHTPLPLSELPAAITLVPRKLLWRAQEAGGGAQQPAPATLGKVEVLTRRPLLPPITRPLDRTPKLIVESAISMEVAMPQINAIGDPLATVKGPPSLGRGSGPGGIGDGTGPGIGDQSGPGLGSNFAERWRGVTAPVVIHRVEPDYPDEARKARFQGSVLVYVEVDEQGRIRSVRVEKPVGLGLDEKAIEAVKQWRFRPATRDGRPVAVPARIDVSFHLL